MSRKDREAKRDAEFTEYLAVRQPSLLRTAYLLTGDRHQAEDVLQTSLAKLYLAWDKIHDRGAVDAYVRRIMVNENNSLWRRPWKKKEYATEVLPEGDPHNDAYDEGTNDRLWEVVQTLPPKARSVVVLRYYEQMSEAEVADALGISIGTSPTSTTRASAARCGTWCRRCPGRRARSWCCATTRS